MKHLYYARHGQSVMNVSGHFAGRTDTPLTEVGRGQAKAAGQQAKAIKIDLIVSSPLVRALETAQIIAREIGYPPENILTNELLIERDYGKTITGMPFDAAPDFASFPDFETDEQLLARARLAADWLKTIEVDTVLAVGHGSSGWALRRLCDPTFTSEIDDLPNAEVIQFL